MVTTNLKSIIGTHTQQTKQESKHNTKDSHQIIREESKGRQNKKY